VGRVSRVVQGKSPEFMPHYYKKKEKEKRILIYLQNICKVLNRT
jgi:hypothetical protein